MLQIACKCKVPRGGGDHTMGGVRARAHINVNIYIYIYMYDTDEMVTAGWHRLPNHGRLHSSCSLSHGWLFRVNFETSAVLIFTRKRFFDRNPLTYLSHCHAARFSRRFGILLPVFEIATKMISHKKKYEHMSFQHVTVTKYSNIQPFWIEIAKTHENHKPQLRVSRGGSSDVQFICVSSKMGRGTFFNYAKLCCLSTCPALKPLCHPVILVDW
jgi:hypothetical protein